MVKIILIFILLMSFVSSVSAEEATTVASSFEYSKVSGDFITKLPKNINLSRDIERLTVLQQKFNSSNNPVERYMYSSALVDYLHKLLHRVEDINEVYYRCSIPIITGEIPNPINKKIK